MNKAEYDDAFGVSNDKQPDLGMRKVRVKPARLKSKAAREHKKTNLESNLALLFSAAVAAIAIAYFCYFILRCPSCTGYDCHACGIGYYLIGPIMIILPSSVLAVIALVLVFCVFNRISKITDGPVRNRIKIKNFISIFLLFLCLLFFLMSYLVR